MLRAKQSSEHLGISASTNPKNLPPFSEYQETSISKNVPPYREESPTNTTYYADEEKHEENFIPNILISENEKVIAHLKSANVFHAMIEPFSYDKVNDNRVHSDASEGLINRASDLPAESKYVVYGFPALIHPKTGVIFGYAMGMGNSYRLPEKIADELQAHQEKELSHVKRKKTKKNSSDKSHSSYSPPPMESNWVDGFWVTKNLLRKCYDYYGREQYKSRVVHLNVDEDFRKLPPPPSFFDKLLDRIYNAAILLGAFLVLIFIYDAMDDFQLLRKIINFLQQR